MFFSCQESAVADSCTEAVFDCPKSPKHYLYTDDILPRLDEAKDQGERIIQRARQLKPGLLARARTEAALEASSFKCVIMIAIISILCT